MSSPPRKVKKGTLLIDSSTIDPAVSREMAVAADKMGAVFMDAPVSGGTSGGFHCYVYKKIPFDVRCLCPCNVYYLHLYGAVLMNREDVVFQGQATSCDIAKVSFIKQSSRHAGRKYP